VPSSKTVSVHCDVPRDFYNRLVANTKAEVFAGKPHAFLELKASVFLHPTDRSESYVAMYEITEGESPVVLGKGIRIESKPRRV
jgi:hypothetical protein